MPVVNWPPATAPAWGKIYFSDLRVMLRELQSEGWTHAVPTTAERNTYFPNSVRCDEGHTVTGRMIISPAAVRYPFAICTNAAHRQLLVLWGPDFCMGGKSGEE